MKSIKVLFVLVLALCCFNVGVFGAILELALSVGQLNCKKGCVRDNHNDQSYFHESGLKGLRCVCKSSQVEQCRAVCINKYNNQAYQASYIENNACLCKKP